MNRDDDIARLSRAPDWRATLIILESAFAKDSRAWRYVDLGREEISFRRILDDGTFSSGERTLLSVAASLFNRDHSINLWDVLNCLDDTNSALVLNAIQSFIDE
jgi:alpha-D-ribose 1-methylphosphonate 5-triphosphate synthase subunit PhnL